MSKESTAGLNCRCGRTIAYPEYHWRHCEEKHSWKPKSKTKKEDKD